VSSVPKTNSKGRTIHRGPKGGLYVFQAGKKIYKFKSTAPPPPPPNKVGRLATPIKKRLVELAKRVKKRFKTKVSTRPRIEFKAKRITFKKITFSAVNGTRTKNSNYEKTLNIEFPNPTHINKNTTMIVEEDKLPLQSWMDAQAKYLDGLNYDDLYTVASYTVRSHQWIGPWIRRTGNPTFTKPQGFIVPLYPQVMKLSKVWPPGTDSMMDKLKTSKDPYTFFKDNISYIPRNILDMVMNMYANDLQRIFKRAPPLPKTMYVYRGLSTDIFKGKVGSTHTLGEFASTGYVPQSVYGYDRYMRIKLLKGTRVLLLQGLNKWHDHGEFEILLNKGSHYIIRSRNVYRPVLNRPRNTIHKKYVSDVTVYN
jgi:hypothetical protein